MNDISVSDILYIFLKVVLPCIELDHFDAIENFIHQLNTIVFLLHLFDLVLHYNTYKHNALWMYILTLQL